MPDCPAPASQNERRRCPACRSAAGSSESPFDSDALRSRWRQESCGYTDCKSPGSPPLLPNLTPGMVLEGTVRNVVDFGAFVDIGLKNDGLIHVSQMSNDYVKHPSDILSTGDIIKCKVLEINKEKNKVALTLKDII